MLEKEFAGFGASGRNGGWLTGDLAGSHERYARRTGRRGRRLQREMYASIDEVIAVCEKEGIDADVVKGGVVDVARTPAQAARLRASVPAARAWGIERGRTCGCSSAGRSGCGWRAPSAATWSPHCARVQPAKLVRGLARAVRDSG